MKIVKRDGRIVEYNRDKIAIAINKANNDVAEVDRVSDKQIDTIIKHIEELNKKRMLVEDIQDMIETELMKLKKFNLAKAYIIYRYNRALVRKNNVTDESILAIIKNNSVTSDHKKKIINVVTQRELIADEVSKNLTKRVLLPEKIIEAQNEGVLYFHDAEYFVQPIVNSSVINLDDMLSNGFVINNIFHKPKSFLEACINLSEIIVSLVNSQYKGFTINIRDLSKYLSNTETNIKSKLKNIKEDKKELIESCINSELNDGIKLINNTINNLEEIVSRDVTLFLELDNNDKYLKYTA
ncbi:MAG: anaerobic ribonucleoside-triphosphate reductase, partial [Bacilli bacterium]|nr:anaerobic ribonucleoside-triphosphate reductase [Bacilli bacterium]